MTTEMVVTSLVNLRNGYLLCPLWISGIGKPVQMKSLDFRTGFRRYVLGFSLGSDIFAWEIAQCIGWEQEIHMSVLKARSTDPQRASSCNPHPDV